MFRHQNLKVSPACGLLGSVATEALCIDCKTAKVSYTTRSRLIFRFFFVWFVKSWSFFVLLSFLVGWVLMGLVGLVGLFGLFLCLFLNLVVFCCVWCFVFWGGQLTELVSVMFDGLVLLGVLLAVSVFNHAAIPWASIFQLAFPHMKQPAGLAGGKVQSEEVLGYLRRGPGQEKALAKPPGSER